MASLWNPSSLLPLCPPPTLRGRRKGESRCCGFWVLRDLCLSIQINSKESWRFCGVPQPTRPRKRPGGPQEGPRGPEDGPRYFQDGPREAQNGPETARERPKRNQDSLETISEAHKTPPRNPKRAPRGVPGVPQEAKIVDFHLFFRCFWPSRVCELPALQDGPRGPMVRPAEGRPSGETATR